MMVLEQVTQLNQQKKQKLPKIQCIANDFSSITNMVCVRCLSKMLEQHLKQVTTTNLQFLYLQYTQKVAHTYFKSNIMLYKHFNYLKINLDNYVTKLKTFKF